MLLPLLLALTALAADQGKAAGPDFYTAAVVELVTPHWPNLSPDEVLVANADIYLKYMQNASAMEVDIIVFPEGGLVGHNNEGKAIELPAAADRATPCGHTTAFHQVLTMLSCGARRYQVYTVVSLAEAYNNDTINKTQLFTTSVAFDRHGTVVARYRKYHPYGKSADKPPLELQYFETDFGITFGMLISFDIQFLEPGILLAREHGIKHFVFPNCWVSALPFFTAVQTQWSWAYGLDVVLLASGCHYPPGGATGSGLYLGRRGALRYTQSCDVTSNMLVAAVPKSLEFPTSLDVSGRNTVEPSGVIREPFPLSSTGDSELQPNNSLFLLRDYVDVYESRLLPSVEDAESTRAPDTTQQTTLVVKYSTETTLCSNLICCNFQVNISSPFNTTPASSPARPDDFSRLFYRLVAFDGVRSYGGGVATGGIQVCGVISCVNESLTSCGLSSDHASQVATLGPLYKTSTVFESLNISASFLYNSTFIYPDLLVTGTGQDFGALVPSDSFSFDTTDPRNGSLTASLKLIGPQRGLVTAAIYARQFNRDGQKRSELPSPSQARSPSQDLFGWLTLIFTIALHFIE